MGYDQVMENNGLFDGRTFLAAAGLNLFAVFACSTLPESVTEVMRETAVPLTTYSRLVLLGHGGKQLWQAMQPEDWETADPIDSYSIRLTQHFIKTTLDGTDSLLLYPNTPYLIPLQQLGELAGWCAPSPLGISISSEFGVWFAYRSAFLTNYPLPISNHLPDDSPCDSCVEKPCIAACPAGAVGEIGQFDLNTCAKHRLKAGSTCADRCLARMACPVAPQHKYTLPQIQYHYGHSLVTLQRYAKHLNSTNTDRGKHG